jgi:hypothetical protein
LETYYLDTPRLNLRKARVGRDRYLTLRIRTYKPQGESPGGASLAYAISAKTEDQKFRVPIDPDAAIAILAGNFDTLARQLPANLLARLLELAADSPILPVACVRCHRYAVEDDQDRLTLDTNVRTGTGKTLPHAVLEFKSTKADNPPESLAALHLRPIKLSKFLWATEV